MRRFSFFLFGALFSVLFTSQARAFQFNTAAWNSCALARPSCLAHYNAGCRTDGLFKLNVAGTTRQVFCDMTQDGGGWTRLNSSIATAAPAFGASDTVSTPNVGQGCGGTLNTVSYSGVAIAHTLKKWLMTRSTTVVQCPVIFGMGASVSYQNGGSWIPQTVCTWANPWSQSSSTSDFTTTGLPLVWKGVGASATTSFGFRSGCTSAADNGVIQLQIFVK